MEDQLVNVLNRVQGAVYKAHHQYKNNIPPEQHPQEQIRSPEAKQPMLSSLLETIVAPKKPFESLTLTKRPDSTTPISPGMY